MTSVLHSSCMFVQFGVLQIGCSWNLFYAMFFSLYSPSFMAFVASWLRHILRTNRKQISRGDKHHNRLAFSSFIRLVFTFEGSGFIGYSIPERLQGQFLLFNIVSAKRCNLKSRVWDGPSINNPRNDVNFQKN